ncbi:MAG TPA: SUMF1/EgtB/PvdO family nonheme iron enzyme [Polyangiaceae bacterium]
MRFPLSALLLVLAAALALGCNRGKPSSPAPGAPGAASASARAADLRAPSEPVRGGGRSEIPTGAFRAGSMPGDPGRRPELEPRITSIELGGFQIDRLPYPNDPKLPPLSGVTREEAARLCAERGARLCTELEWERACKGPASDRYPTGDTWDPRCAKEPAACASGFDVLAMGAAFREWVKGDIAAGGGKLLGVTRGASASAPAEAHRCAARTGTEPETKDAGIGFRCCGGPPNARLLPEPKLGQAYQKPKLGAERLAALLAADPITRELAKDVKFFREPDSANTVVDRGPGDRKGFSFTVLPLVWNPAPGAEILIATARSGEHTSFVVAYYVLGEDQYRLAASFVMKNEPGPVALAYSDDIRPRLHFSTCWGCPGETGKILFRRPERVAIVEP